jgi:Domain of unknown function (DUF4262)
VVASPRKDGDGRLRIETAWDRAVSPASCQRHVEGEPGGLSRAVLPDRRHGLHFLHDELWGESGGAVPPVAGSQRGGASTRRSPEHRMSHPASQRERDRVLAKTRTLIRRHGWCVLHLHSAAGGPVVNYTVGFTETLGVPEVLIAGVDIKTATMILNALGQRLRAVPPDQRVLPNGRMGGVLSPPFDLGITGRGAYAHVGYLEVAAWYYGHAAFEVVQAVIPDTANRLPGFDVGCDPTFVSRQHVPDRPPPALATRRAAGPEGH